MPIINTYIQHNIRHSSQDIVLEKVSTWKERSKLCLFTEDMTLCTENLYSLYTHTHTQNLHGNLHGTKSTFKYLCKIPNNNDHSEKEIK